MMSTNKNAQKKNHITAIAVGLSLLAVILITFIVIRNSSENNTSSNTDGASVAKNSDLIIQTSDITETAKFFPVEIDGTKLEVLAVKAPDGSIRTAFNTCQVCYSSGRGYYVQEGDVLVCQNCGNRFGMSDVEVTRGGCNPVPITDENKTADGTSITISNDYLSAAKVIFANWKNA